MSNAKFREGRVRPGLFGKSHFMSAPAPKFMHDGKWIIHWRKLGLALGGLLLMAAAVLAPLGFQGCFASREAAINDKQGNPLWVDESGKATKEATSPAGQPRERATVPVSSGAIESMGETASNLPGPVGAVAGIVSVIANAGLAAYLVAARRKRLEELGLTEDMIEIADANEDTRKKLTNHPNPKVRDKVAAIRRKRIAAPALTPVPA